VVNAGTTLIRLWRNECLRVFEDRLITQDDKDFVGKRRLPDIIKDTFPSQAEEALADPLIWGDFQDALNILLSSDSPWQEVRLYQDMGDYGTVRKIFNELLENYNAEKRPMNLVLFEDALSHLVRIHRIIRMPQGNALLVGTGGSGRQSLTKLATFAAGYTLSEITLSRGYGDTEFRDDLKALYTEVVSAPRTFLFTDAHVVEEGFLEYLNNLLTVGMVPALFAEDEKEGLIGKIRKEASEQGIRGDRMWNFCVSKARENLHLVLAMSPAGSSLRTRCRNFPGLVSCTSIDWFFPWPSEALHAVASHFLQNESLPDESRDEIVQHFVMVHLSVTEKYSPEFEMQRRRKNYATPKNYLDFINNYRSKLAENRKNLDAMSQRLEGGLTKLIQAAEAVEIMSKELAEKKVIVDENARKVEALIHDINEKSEKANKRQEEATAAAEQIARDNEIITKEKAEADVALAAAIPALEMAAQALENLDKKDITEIKAFTTPPKPVMYVCMCVVVLVTPKSEGDGWNGAKAMLSDVNFMKSLLEYPKDDITDKQVKKIKDYFSKDPESFEGQAMKKISVAGNGLLTWVKAMVHYHEVARTVEPKRKLVRELQQKKETAERNLAAIQKELVQLTEQIEKLTADQVEQSAKLKELQDEAATMERRLTAASHLIEGLGSERVRWTADLQSQAETKKKLVGDCLVGAGFLSYTGPFSFDFRHRMVVDHWLGDVTDRNIPMTSPFKLEDLLTSDVEVALWAGQGLPSDELSVQNGILTTRASRFPLCIDPQMQAVHWIKSAHEKNGLVVKTFNDDYAKHLELAIQYGKPFLFEGIDNELDPMIDPVLEKSVTVEGGQTMITLGDNQIEWSDSFLLFLTTKLSNPSYSPEVMGKVSIINYTVTMQGLQDQLLNVVVGFERPDLEKERQELIHRMSEDKQTLKQLEDVLLRELAQSKGSILDNEELIATLQNTKEKAVEIAKSLEDGKVTAVEIDKLRSVYQRVAKRGSILYFSMVGLANISFMYEYSLNAYLGVFERSLREARPDRIVDNRLKNVTEKLTQNVYDFVCMGIFENHKLMFSFQMTTMIMDGEAELQRDELDFFTKGNTSLEQVQPKSPGLEWFPDGGWKDLQLLTKLKAPFETLLKDIQESVQVWKDWYDLERPEDEPIPMGYSESLSMFQKMLVIRCFRTDRVYNAIKNFVIWRLQDYYVQPPSLQYDKIFAQSSENSPVVFILSPGADPQSDVQKLGEHLGFSGTKFKFLALGQGMGQQAANYIETGYQRGHWVMLQNCHLLASWLKTLEKILEGMHKPHKDFRLWLTTLPTDAFPLGILQRSLKVVTEPPDGLKLNVKGSYTKLSDEDLDECPHPAYRSLVWVVAFFHAVVQERRKYGKIGWNVSYDFNESDFRISIRLLSMYLGKAFDNDDPVPWSSLKYLIGEAMYGGRVTDDFDRRVLVTYLSEYMGDFLFDEDQPFFFSQSGFDYQVPNPGPLDVYQNYIKELPLINSPEVFGLHPNAEIGYFTDSAKRLWHGLITMQTSEGAVSGGVNRDEYIKKVATDIEDKLPKEELKFVKDDVPTPSEVVLMQEIERFNALVSRMGLMLADLKRALKGEIGISAELDEMGNSLFNGFLPPAWARLAPATLKPLGSWMEHFTRRYKQYVDWATQGEPSVFWMSGFHIPDSLLTALVQATCRKKGWALDKSTLYTVVTKFTDRSQVTKRLEHGTYIEGLYLEGARWDMEKGCLTRQNPKELVQEMPLIQIVPIEANRLKLRDSLTTPVYVTQDRRNAMGVGWVFDANLHTKEHPSLWVLQGVALCLNTDI